MNRIGGYDLEDLELGMTACFEKTISDADIHGFAAVTGDFNAIHLDEAYAGTTPFRGRIAHGMLTASAISAAIAGRLPGPGTVYLGQSLNFKAPIRPGASIRATVTVTGIDYRNGTVRLSTVCTVGGRIVLNGRAVVKPTRRASPEAASGA
jgi:3-hydroxybutyryl-CoA dehydratase